MTKVYPAILHKEDGYWVEFPDLEGCNTCGTTIEETMELASEALGLYLASLLEDDQAFPPATEIADIKVDGNLVNYIAVDVEKYIKNTKAVKKTVSIPSWLAEEAENRHLSLSKVLQDGIKAHLDI